MLTTFVSFNTFQFHLNPTDLLKNCKYNANVIYSESSET